MADSPDNLYPITVIEDMRIPLEDGISLSARVWMPQTETHTPFPAVIEYIPYRKTDGTIARDEKIHPFIAERGYVCLRIDLRGSGDSDGILRDEYTQTELDDAVFVINWIAHQTWCTGAVGMMGKSWGGFNALQTAALAPDALKAIVTGYTTTDRFADDIHYKGGCLLGDNLRWGAVMLAYSARAADPLIRPHEWYDMWLERLEAEPFLSLNWLAHQRRDSYWQHGSVCETYHNLKAAILVFAGWADNYMNAPFELLTHRNDTRCSAVKAIIGPWGHQYPHMAAPEPRIGFLTEMLRWWDHWLKEADTGANTEPDLRYFQQESVRPQRYYHHRPGQWRSENSWPSTRVSSLRFQMTAHNGLTDQSLVSEALNMVISTPQHCGLAAGEFFPMALASTDHSQPGPPELPGDQRADDALSVCFETDILSDEIAILGSTQLRLRLSSATEQGQIFARLCDVAPDGASTFITHGMLNLAHRDSFSEPEPMRVGTVYDVSVNLDHMSYVLPKGHRLRLALSTAYFPFVWPSPQTTCLTILSGYLELPTHNNPKPDQPETSFTQPENPAGWPAEILRTAHYNRQIHQDLSSGVISLFITTDSGRAKDLRHELITDTIADEKWSIHPDDPLSARAEISWVQRFERDGWALCIETGATMHSDKDQFFLTGYIRASQNNHHVFEKIFDQTVARDNR